MNDTLVIAASIFISVYLLAFVIYMGFKQHLRLREKQFDLESRIKMDDFRSHLERRIVELNKDFSQDGERFDELNHLVLSGQSNRDLLQGSRVANSAFLRAHGIDVLTEHATERSIFVLSPFHSDFDETYEAIKNAGTTTNYRVVRGDERVERSDIFSQILRGIVSSRFIVANITGRNPNVFYELGIAHALDKEVILIAESQAEIPFDLKSKRIVFFDSSRELTDKLIAAIARLSEV